MKVSDWVPEAHGGRFFSLYYRRPQVSGYIDQLLRDDYASDVDARNWVREHEDELLIAYLDIQADSLFSNVVTTTNGRLRAPTKFAEILYFDKSNPRICAEVAIFQLGLREE